MQRLLSSFIALSLMALVSVADATSTADVAPHTSPDPQQARWAKLEQEAQTLYASLNQLQTQIQELEHADEAADADSDTIKTKRSRHLLNKIPSIYKTRQQDQPVGGELRPPIYFDASHLLINFASMREDLAILRHLKTVDQKHPESGAVRRTAVVVSGGLDGRVATSRSYANQNTSDIDLSGASLNVFGTATPWAFAFLSVEYDNSNPATSTRANHANIFLDRAFITAGDLAHNPNYLSIGQFYMPFGFHETFMISNQLSKSIGRVKQRGLVWGHVQPTWNTELFIFNGETNVGGHNGINQGGASVTTKRSYGDYHWKFGTSVISQLAEAGIFQDTGQSSGFQGFGNANADENLAHRVPAWSGHVSFTCREAWGATLEWVTALRDFDSADLSFNNQGARPAAIHLEAITRQQYRDLPFAFAGIYEHSWESMAVSLPEDRVALVASTHWWQDTTLALEYRWDHNYSGSDTATGSGNAVTHPGSVAQSLIAEFSLRF